MATSSQQQAINKAGAATGARVMALDSHVHLYPCADLGMALSAGRDNLAAAARRAGRFPDTFGLALTETQRDSAFEGLASGRLRAQGWRIETAPADDAVLVAKRERDDAELLLFAGSQIVTRERIEVLALCTRQRFADGSPVRDIIADLSTLRVPAVLPWGLGKWTGVRGTVVKDLLSETASPRILIGDNAGRPRHAMPSVLFRRAVSGGIAILPGTDPLSLAGAEAGIGQYGCLIEFQNDTEWPADGLRRQLLNLRVQPEIIGRRRGLISVIREQVALRRQPVRGIAPSRDREA